MTNEEIAEQIYDELQHNRLNTYEEYSARLYELLDKAHPNDKLVGTYVGDVENILHNKWSFGFCDMCDGVLFYDYDAWYDLAMLEPEEAIGIDEVLDSFEREKGGIIQDVCVECFNKLMKKTM